MEKKKRKTLNVRKMAVRLLFIGVISYGVYTIASQQVSLIQKQKEIERIQKMTANANGEKAKLEEELELIGTDEYKEQKARELLGYVKPDERIYIDVTK